MLQDSRGIMWLGTNSGLYFYDGVTVHTAVKEELSGTQIYSLIEHEGRLYIGGNNGLLSYDYESGTLAPGDDAPPKEIRCMLLYGSELWVGSLYGLFRMDLHDGKVSDCSPGLPHKSVYSMLRDSRGILYAGTYNGLARWNPGNGRVDKVENGIDNPGRKNLFVNCLLEAPDC